MTLIEEIQAKCSAELIATGNYHDIAVAVNVGRVKTVKTPIADVQAYLQETGAWWAIKAVAATVGHPAKTAAEAVLDVGNARYNNIDTSLPIVGQMLGGLVAASALSQEQMDYLMAMGTSPDPVSWQQCNQAVDDFNQGA